MLHLKHPGYIPLLVSNEEAKDFLNVHLDEPELIPMLEAIQGLCEAYCHRSFTERTYVFTMDKAETEIELPRGPVISITSIETLDTLGAATTVATSTYYLANDRLIFNDIPELSRDYGGLKITYLAGDKAQTPATVKQGMLKALSTLYEHREDVVTGTIATRLDQNAERLLAPWVKLV